MKLLLFIIILYHANGAFKYRKNRRLLSEQGIIRLQENRTPQLYYAIYLCPRN